MNTSEEESDYTPIIRNSSTTPSTPMPSAAMMGQLRWVVGMFARAMRGERGANVPGWNTPHQKSSTDATVGLTN